PFASPNALFNLSKLSVWWLRLGIQIERIKPGNPQQNGRHERMHLTLKKEATRPPGMNTLQQQAKFDEFIQEFNQQRPHEALDMKCPAEVYTPSTRLYRGLPDVTYPLHDRDITVTACGRICLLRKKINISIVFAGHTLGIKEVDDGIWLVSFMHSDLGYIDLEQKTLQPLDNPFGPRVSPMSPVRSQPADPYPTARCVTGAAMAQPFDEISTAIPGRIAIRPGHIDAGACENRVPDRQRPARIEIPRDLVRLVRLFDRGHVLHKESVERLDILVGDLGVRRIGHGGIEVMPVLGDARPHRTIEFLQRIIADAGVGIWRDVGRMDHAHGRSHAQAPGKGLAALHGMTGDAVA